MDARGIKRLTDAESWLYLLQVKLVGGDQNRESGVYRQVDAWSNRGEGVSNSLRVIEKDTSHIQAGVHSEISDCTPVFFAHFG